MKIKNLLILLFALILGFFFASCAIMLKPQDYVEVPAPVIFPPKIDMSGIKTIIIGNFNEGKKIAPGDKYFNEIVFMRNELMNFLGKYGNYQIIDGEGLNFGSLEKLGIDADSAALVEGGLVVFDYDEDTYVDRSGENIIIDRVGGLDAEVEFTIKFLKNDEEVYNKFIGAYREMAKSRTIPRLNLPVDSGEDFDFGDLFKAGANAAYDAAAPEIAQPESIDLRLLLRDVFSDILDGFAPNIIAHEQAVSVYFMTNAYVDSWDGGIGFAKSGDWQKAKEYFSFIAKKAFEDVNAGKAYYNLALCYQYTYEFEKALSFFNMAKIKLQKYEEFDVESQIANCKAMQKEHSRLK